jgi:hypothetical protein
MIFDSNISALEEREDLATLTMDELHGTLTTYEMRTEQENLVTKEQKFKAYKRSKKKGKQKENLDSSNSDISEDDKKISNFIRRLKRALVHIGKISTFYLRRYGQNWPYCRKIEEILIFFSILPNNVTLAM